MLDTQPETVGHEVHPLEPLSADELRWAVAILRAGAQLKALSTIVRFGFVSLHEPTKDALREGAGGKGVDRAVELTLLDRGDGRSYEAVVSLTTGTVTAWQPITDGQPAALFDEGIEAERVVKAHPDFVAALARRGITNLDQVIVDAWASGNFGLPEEQGRRLSRALPAFREVAGDNTFARPIEDLVVTVDMTRMEVMWVTDYRLVPVPPDRGNYGVDAVGPLRADLKPLHITQPEGPSFTVEGHEIRWQKWHIRIGFTAREGLVLHTVGYEDSGRLRSILHRASLSEMVVPYGDPSPSHYFKNAFDAGEIGIGISANSLELGCDCLGEIRYFDVPLVNNWGEVEIKRNAICLHEEDYGMLWKHYDWRTNVAEVRRSRRLVVSSVSTLGNYEYGFGWYFYQDGTIQHEIKLTGLLIAGALEEGERPRYGTVVAPRLQAVNHQHFFNYRLDFDVDGTRNQVYEVHSEPAPPGPDNPYHNAFVARRTLLRTELEAQQLVDPFSARCWDIVNPDVLNGLGQPVAYRLIPGDNVIPMARPEASVIKRAGFITKHLWVTPYAPDERYAGGDYPHMHPGGAGLPAYTAGNRSLEDTDLVVWYTFGSHHIPRPEDWPVMPTVYTGFMLKPSGFFDRNPALDVPPSTSQGHCRHE